MGSAGWDDGGVRWRSGGWTLELRGDELADLAYERRPVLRSIRAVVRDRDWSTAPLMVDRVRETGGTLTLHVRSEALGSSFAGVVRVEARTSRLDVVCDLESRAAFETNRTGLVVLHPPHVAGAPLRVAHPDGSVDETAFPVAISPHQPALDIAALSWLDDGLEVSTVFGGDVFEMEDQRNWTDASFKTYSRPLELPFPYALAAGERVRQTVSVRVRDVAADAIAADAPTVIALAPSGVFPAVGVAASTAPDPAPAGLRAVGDELVVELDLDTPSWPAALRRAAGSGLALDVRVVLAEPDPGPLGALARALRGLDVARVAVFHPTLHVSDAVFVDALRAALVAADVGVPVVGGSRSHFTELNRERHRLPGGLDGVVITLTPLFHSLSGAQLRESVAMQRLVARRSVALADGLPVRIGPVSLRPRFNDVATAPQPASARDDLAEGYGAELTGGVDERQTTPELAAWTVASAAALAVPGVAGLTYFEEWGPRGIRSADGDPYPSAAAVEALAGLAGSELLAGESPDGLVWALGARTPDGDVVLVANLDLAPRTFEVSIAARDAACRRIPVSLPPLGWARVP